MTSCLETGLERAPAIHAAAHLANLEQPASFTEAMLEFPDANAPLDEYRQRVSSSSRREWQADGAQ